ncbi:MAG: ankyrin repeat domain-containing protein [Rhodocyclaceae bacterium]|nr:ankyrin repeat domain-containing protein [Rhodocyclaceae bacterium]MBR4738215.1 ankyrin repeat domain-containing protein [Rhodocyclaceae bacterium]MBR4877958.1 ankyrin repeat domain-containing protein [Rhodocyclaceae bacterium]
MPKHFGPLAKAAAWGDVESIRQRLMQREYSQASLQDALLYAAAGDHADIAELLLDAGAPVNATANWDDRKYTALMAAAWQGNFEVARLLVARGAAIDSLDECGQTALMYAAGGHGRVVRFLLEHGADAGVAGKYRTALMSAASCGCVDIARMLLAAGADIHARKEGTTALLCAAQAGRLAMVRFLASQGADLHARNAEGRTALMLAADGGYWALCRFLIAQGLNVNAADKDGITALVLACAPRYSKTMRILLDAGADTNAAPNRHGYTPLMYAALQCSPDMVRLMLYHGARRGLDAAISIAQNHDNAAVLALLRAARETPANTAP